MLSLENPSHSGHNDLEYQVKLVRIFFSGMIYESSCFKMDTIFSLEFDRKKYYEDLKEKAQQEQTNNTND